MTMLFVINLNEIGSYALFIFYLITIQTVILSEECTNDMSMHHALLAAFERRPDLRFH